MAEAQGNALISVSGGDAPGANPLIPFFGYPLNADQLVNPAYNLPHEAIGLSDGQVSSLHCSYKDLHLGIVGFRRLVQGTLTLHVNYPASTNRRGRRVADACAHALVS